MKKIEFLKDVEHEIRMLKKHATDRELSRLDLNIFNYNSTVRCIYGQMTGNCGTRRAKVLMNVACIRVFDLNDGASDIGQATFSKAKKYINGENKGQGWIGKPVNKDGLAWNARDFKYLSALEGYICLKGAKIKNIMSYLKGETNKIKL